MPCKSNYVGMLHVEMLVLDASTYKVLIGLIIRASEMFAGRLPNKGREFTLQPPIATMATNYTFTLGSQHRSSQRGAAAASSDGALGIDADIRGSCISAVPPAPLLMHMTVPACM